MHKMKKYSKLGRKSVITGLILQASRTWFGRVGTSDPSKVRKLIYIVTLKRDLTFEWHNKIQFQNRKKNQ